MREGNHEAEIVGSIFIAEESSRRIEEIINTLIEIRDKWEGKYRGEWDSLRTSVRTSDEGDESCVLLFEAVRDLSVEKQIVKTKEEITRLTLVEQSVGRALKLQKLKLQDFVNLKQRKSGAK